LYYGALPEGHATSIYLLHAEPSFSAYKLLTPTYFSPFGSCNGHRTGSRSMGPKKENFLSHILENFTSIFCTKSFISLPSDSSSFPIAANFFGLAVKSFPSPRLALPLKEVSILISNKA
jgi:hypothetical protein